MRKQNSTYFIDSSLSDYDYLVLDNLSNLNEEHDKTFKEDEKVSDSVYYHGSIEDIEGYLNKPINFITKDFDYAKTFALDNGYVYKCSANLGNLLDVGKTDVRVFDMIPSTPLKFSREFTAIIRKLNVSENSIRRVIDNVADEYKVNPYGLAIRPVVRSIAFKRILEGLGFDGIRAIEYDSINNKDVETFGLFYQIKVLDKVKVNESLDEEVDFELPQYLYHATYKPFLKSIKEKGLGNTRRKMWSDSKGRGVVYLALDKDVAYSYAENAEWLDDVEDYDKYADNIIVLKIDANKLDKEKLFVDGNVLDDDSTLEYHEIIPFDAIVEVIEESLKHTNESLNEEKAITWGDLDYAQKTDTRKMMKGRGTGHFGTGFYFVGKEGPYGLDKDNNIKGYDYEPSRPIYEIDLDKYNLYKPKDNDSAYRLHDAMASINNYYSPDMNKLLFSNIDTDALENSFYDAVANLDEDIDDDFDDLDFDFDDVEDTEEDDLEKDSTRDNSKYLEKAKEWIENNGLTDWISTGYDDLDTWLDKNKNKLGLIEKSVEDAINNRDRYLGYVEYAIDVLCKVFNTDRNTLMAMCKAFYNMKSEDTISTLLFKEFGYEGVDVTHLNHDAQGLSGLDNFGYGTVIYDLKPGTFKKIKEPRENGNIHAKAGESLDEYFDRVEDSGEQYHNYEVLDSAPIFVTDEIYKIKNMIENDNTPYRILYLNKQECYLIQNALGNKTHGDMFGTAVKKGFISNDDYFDDEDYFVFIPKGFSGKLRYHTRLGEDSYDDCRVYPYGVVFVRDSFAYNNKFIKALGEPEREVHYDSEDEKVTVLKGETKKVIDVKDDLYDEPNNALTYDVDSNESKADLPDDVTIRIVHDLNLTYDEFKTMDSENVFNIIKEFLHSLYNSTPKNFDWGNSPTTIFVRDIEWE